jgi:hypothetical protein
MRTRSDSFLVPARLSHSHGPVACSYAFLSFLARSTDSLPVRSYTQLTDHHFVWLCLVLRFGRHSRSSLLTRRAVTWMSLAHISNAQKASPHVLTWDFLLFQTWCFHSAPIHYEFVTFQIHFWSFCTCSFGATKSAFAHVFLWLLCCSSALSLFTSLPS